MFLNLLYIIFLVQIRTNMGKTHSSHPEHELELKNYQKPYTCNGCKEQGVGKRYRCEECDYDLHEDCMFNKSTTTHEFFKEFTFKFYDKPPPRKCDKIYCNKCIRYCNACGKHVKGFVYHCDEDENDWDLHPCCRNLKNELKIEGVKFHLGETVSKCSWCNQTKIKDGWSKIKGWSYVSECDKYHFHVYCAMEMVIEGWKNGTANSNDCLALENLELPIQRQLNRNSGRGNKYWRIAKVFLKTIVSILLGDPTITLGSLLVDLVIK